MPDGGVVRAVTIMGVHKYLNIRSVIIIRTKTLFKFYYVFFAARKCRESMINPKQL